MFIINPFVFKHPDTVGSSEQGVLELILHYRLGLQFVNPQVQVLVFTTDPVIFVHVLIVGENEHFIVALMLQY